LRKILHKNKDSGYSRPHYFIFYFLLSAFIISFILSGTVLLVGSIHSAFSADSLHIPRHIH
jgi:hypothetical protein